MWFKLKESVYQMCFNIDNVDGSKDTIKDVLFDPLEKAWPLINECLVDNLIRSMES